LDKQPLELFAVGHILLAPVCLYKCFRTAIPEPVQTHRLHQIIVFNKQSSFGFLYLLIVPPFTFYFKLYFAECVDKRIVFGLNSHCREHPGGRVVKDADPYG